MPLELLSVLIMGFGKRLLTLRKEKGLTQQALSDKSGVHVVQIRRYENDAAQPSLEVIRKLSIALGVTADALVFDDTERGPEDQQLKLQFEAVSKLDTKEREAIKTMIDGVLLMHDAKQYTSRTSN